MLVQDLCDKIFELIKINALCLMGFLILAGRYEIVFFFLNKRNRKSLKQRQGSVADIDLKCGSILVCRCKLIKYNLQ